MTEENWIDVGAEEALRAVPLMQIDHEGLRLAV